MEFSASRKAGAEELNDLVEMSRTGLRNVEEKDVHAAQNMLAGYQRLAAGKVVYVVEYVSVPEGTVPQLEPTLLTIQFYIDLETGFVYFSVLPFGTRNPSRGLGPL